MVGFEEVGVQCMLEEGVVDIEYHIVYWVVGGENGCRNYLIGVIGCLEDDFDIGFGCESS